MKKSNIYLFLAASMLLTSCDDLFEPAIENQKDISIIWDKPVFAQELLGNAYILLPYATRPESDLATDDAVSSSQQNNYARMATGSWSSSENPVSQWQGRGNAIQYINIFLENCDKVAWDSKDVVRTMYSDRFKGECYAMRALQTFYMLRAHCGYVSDGQLMGIPLQLEAQDGSSNFNQPRNTFKECIDQMMDDIDKAMELLRYEDGNISNANEIPEKYRQMDATTYDYNRVFGSGMRGRINGRITEAIRAQIALFAASPAYNEESGVTWAQAADLSAVVLDRIGGLAGLDPTGWSWFANHNEIDNLDRGENPAEMLWRGTRTDANNSDLETAFFPPSLYGEGGLNPTQNLVDAFPMDNGYPITDSHSGYDANNPYEGRDPRLKTYILVNGDVIGASNTEIITGTYGTNRDAINRDNGYSTRTGYYLRKWLRSDVGMSSSVKTGQRHYAPRIRYTEIFLSYAEAANEAYGPTATGGHSYSAYDVVKAIRSRAGVGRDNGDPYLESIKNDKDKMRELIRNERRLELCFENHRFWDLRRWKVDLTKLNEAAQGMQIDENPDGSLKYTILPRVEIRDYKEYMYYGPIPYSETQKYSNLEQNKGWQ